MNHPTTKLLALAAATALFAGTACAAGPGQERLDERDVRQAISDAGYTDVDDLDFDDGIWEADARRDGRSVDLRIAPGTGTVYPGDGRTSLNREFVRASLEAAGYQRIRDLEFDDGMWEGEAEYDGVDYDLYMDPETAEVVARKRD